MTDHLICFVLGGPGSGKGTLCQELVRDMGFDHISLGDLIRKFMSDNPEHPRAIAYQKTITDGNCIPSKEATQFLLDVTKETFSDKNRVHKVLIDGYPRTMEQLEHFNDLSPIPFCHKNTYSNMFMLYVDTPQEVMRERMTGRGRDFRDGDDEIMNKRFSFYYNETMPVIDHIKSKIPHKFLPVDGMQPPDTLRRYVRRYFASFTIEQTIIITLPKRHQKKEEEEYTKNNNSEQLSLE